MAFVYKVVEIREKMIGGKMSGEKLSASSTSTARRAGS